MMEQQINKYRSRKALYNIKKWLHIGMEKYMIHNANMNCRYFHKIELINKRLKKK